MAGISGMPVWAMAIIGILVAVLFIALFYGMILLVGGVLANTLNTVPGGSTALSGGVSPYSGFVNLFLVVFTVGSFAYIAILLAAVSVVFVVFWYLLSGGMGGGTAPRK